MIIDCHLHLNFSRGEAWQPLLQQQFHHMETVGIERSCLMPHPLFSGCMYPNKESMVFQAETLSDIAAKYPETFYPLLLACPLLPYDFTLSLIEKYVIGGPLIGLKFWASLLADDERYEPIYNYLEKHDIPLLFHSWYKTVGRLPYESEPGHIAAMARKHPKLRIIMAHATGARLRGIQDIKRLPNVLLDTSGSQPEEGYLEHAINELGADRVIFGSDYPIRSFHTQLARMDSIDMSKEDKEKVMFKNAIRFFRKGSAT